MVRPAFTLAILVALAGTAAASAMPRRMGMFAPAGSALPMLDSKLAVTVRGAMVEATVAQTFRNDADHPIEATYVFPLPADAAVSAMAIDYGTRTIHASIVKRDVAQRRYEDAVAAGLGAGLLDEERPDVFTQTVSAIPSHATVVVTLRFDTVARYESGTWQLVLPMVVAPRYVPGTASGRPTTGTGHAPDTDRAPDASRVTPNAAPGAGGKTEILIDLAGPAEDVTSPTHELQKRGTGYAIVDEHSDHDAIVRWRAKAPEAGWVEQDDDGGYAAVLVSAPPAAARTRDVRVVLVLDRAATTRGDAEAVERPIARALIAALGTKDQVALGTGDWQTPEPALRALDQLWSKPAGPFDLTKALMATYTHAAPVLLVTDGLVADDNAAIAAAKHLGVPVHVIGLGSAPNRSLLAAIATATGGTVRFAIAGDDLGALAQATIADLATPPAPLAVTWGTLVARDVVPAVMPRLGAGQAALVVARVDRAHAANARARGDVFAFASIDVKHAPEGATTTKGPLARRWARMKLDELIAAGDHGAIAAHALRYGLVSPATSMIAIGDEVVVTGGVKHTVPVPVSLPAGMQWQTVHHELAVDTAAREPETSRSQEHKAKAGERTAKPNGDRTPKKPIVVAQPRPVPPAPAPVSPTTKQEPSAPKHDVSDDEDEDRRGADKSFHASESRESIAPAAPTARPPVATTQAAPDVGMAEGSSAETEEVVTVAESPRGLHHRLRLSLAFGTAIENGDATFLVINRASFEVGGRTRFGVEGSLWLLSGGGGLTAQGTLLGTVGRIGVSHHLDLLGGLGLHLGDGLGPAGALGLRWRFAPHVASYLRYDGALLLHDTSRDGQNAATVGVEASF